MVDTVILGREDGHWIVNLPQFVYTVMDSDGWVNAWQWTWERWHWVRCHIVHLHAYRYHIINRYGIHWSECLLCHKKWN